MRSGSLGLVRVPWVLTWALVLCAVSPAAGSDGQRRLTPAERVAYQRAIEAVNWQYRIWPKENPQTKPPLEDVLPLSAMRTKVEDDLRQSQALAVIWKRPITAAALQREMERIARETHQPERLWALFAALGHDPYLITHHSSFEVHRSFRGGN